MGKQKKKGKQDKALQTIILLTATLNLIEALIEIIRKLIWEQGRETSPTNKINFCMLIVNR